MKFNKLFLTNKQIEILKGEAVINTLYSLLDDNRHFHYDTRSVKQLIRKLQE